MQSYFGPLFVEWPLARQALVTLAVLLAVGVVHRLTRSLIRRGVTDPEHARNYSSLVRTLFLVLGVVLVTGVWLEELKTIGLVLTGVLAGFLIGFKEVFLSLICRVVLAVIKPYKLGDRISINGIQGDVINLGLLYTWVFESGGEDGSKQASGRVSIFPHAWLILHPLTNSSMMRGFLWDELVFHLPGRAPVHTILPVVEAVAKSVVEADLAKARKAAAPIHRNFTVRLPPLQPKVYVSLPTDIRDIEKPEIRMSLRYMVRERAIRDRRHELTMAILPILREMNAFSPESSAEIHTETPTEAPLEPAKATSLTDTKAGE